MLVQIRSKGFERRPLKKMPDVVRVLMKYVMVIFLPLFTLFCGFIVWRRQRARRERIAQEFRSVA